MFLSRYQSVNELLIPNWLGLKFNFQLGQLESISSVAVQAGLYKLSSVYPQHALILSELSGQPSAISNQIHGKRQKQTSLLTSLLYKQSVWLFIDRYLNEMLYLMKDYKTPKYHKAKKLAKSIAMKNRQRFTDYADIDDVVEPVMHDTHRGVYLPLATHFHFKKQINYAKIESVLRAFRIPLSFAKRKKRKAFDDRVSFSRYV